MSELTINALNESQPATQKKIFDLAISKFDLTLPLPWANEAGVITVNHVLRRPTPAQELEYKNRSVFMERVSSGQTRDEAGSFHQAVHWLWDNIADEIGGYPGMNGNLSVTPEVAAKMRPTHKEIAIVELLECEATILPDQSVATWDGGEWAVRLRVGPKSHPYGVFIVVCHEWAETQKSTFEKNSQISTTETQGKTQLRKSGINQKAFTALFDGILADVRPDPESLWNAVVANGKTFAEAGTEGFAKAFLSEWKVEVIAALTQFWRRRLSD